MRHNVEGGLGNCIVRDDTKILQAVTNSIDVDGVVTDSYDVSVARFYDLQNRQPLASDHDYADVPNMFILSEYKVAAVAYIAGYVVRMVKQRIACLQCQSALAASHNVLPLPGDIGSRFIRHKDHGGLVKPSSSVIAVCQETERCFDRMKAVVGDNLPLASGFPAAVANVVLSAVGQTAFADLDCHMFDSTPDSNHVFTLIKAVVHCYCKIRLHHLAKQKTIEITGTAVRKQFTKLILFNHQ